MMIRGTTAHRLTLMAAVASVLLASEPAFAHHVMGGRTPSTFAEGLLSGLGHPVIGIDHLAFLAAVGVAIGAAGVNVLLAALFVVASAVGVALHLSGIGIAGAEPMVAISVIAAGVLVARKASSTALWAALLAAGGLLHGYAYGESIYGAETSPLVAYLVGLVVIQSALAVGIAALMRWRAVIAPQLAGAAIAGAGVAVLVQQMVPTP